MIDVFEDHRTPVRGDAARETPADRDSNPLLDLFLDPDRGARHQFVGTLVEEKHRARVRVEDVADARKKHREQLVERKVRECRVGDRLHVLDLPSCQTLRLEGSCMLDCDRCTVAGELQQLHIVLVEHPVHKRPNVENAEQAAADEQRHAEHRLDPLLAQNRVEHVRVIDVFEHHRMPVCGDAPRKSTAHRNPNPSLDLLLDPHCCARDELVRLLVQQQDSARVDSENLAGANKERREENVELQVRERRIRERLKLLQTVGVLDAIPLPDVSLGPLTRPKSNHLIRPGTQHGNAEDHSVTKPGAAVGAATTGFSRRQAVFGAAGRCPIFHVAAARRPATSVGRMVRKR